MPQTSSPRRQVHEAFLLADALKGGWVGRPSFELRMEQVKQELSAHSDIKLESLVQDRARRMRFEKAIWCFETVSLEQCSVWPHMGGKTYATGSVPQAAERFLKHCEKDYRIFDMVEFAKQRLYDVLPLIVFKRKSGSGYRIDDGSHRAVARYLAGDREAAAFVAVAPPRWNLKWKWEGDTYP